MRNIRFLISFSLLLIISGVLMSQSVDLGMIYKIKQEGNRYSAIEDLAFGLTDLTGPRLTGSTGAERGYEWTRKKMEEIGLVNVRIDEAREFSRGGWDNIKTYAAMTAPYYSNLACLPVAWTGSTKGLVKGGVVLLDVNNESDLDKYKGNLAGKIVLMPSTSTYTMSFDPLATRYTDEQLQQIALASSPAMAGRRPMGDLAALAAQRTLRSKIIELLKSEGVAVILNSSGTFNVPRATGASHTTGNPEPIAELNLPVEAHG
ncbi:MAG TPA: hypothetical protein VK861_09685, partial [Bacteroidales bacterium]|nr:hypothetical protein [Bacteroidales bacterium]